MSLNRIWASRTWSLKFAVLVSLNKTIRKVVCFLSGKWEGKISFQIPLRIYGCCKIWWTRRVFLCPRFPFASIEASALRNKPCTRDGGELRGLRLGNVEVNTWRMYSYTLENSYFEHNNGGFVQMIFLCKWVIFRFQSLIFRDVDWVCFIELPCLILMNLPGICKNTELMI